MSMTPLSSDFCIFRRTATGDDTTAEFVVLGQELSGVGLRYRTLGEAMKHVDRVAEAARSAVWYYASERDGGVLLVAYRDR